MKPMSASAASHPVGSSASVDAAEASEVSEAAGAPEAARPAEPSGSASRPGWFGWRRRYPRTAHGVTVGTTVLAAEPGGVGRDHPLSTEILTSLLKWYTVPDADGGIARANELVRAALAEWPNARFVDVFPLMFDPAGRVRRELFTEDWLHLSRAGYLLWAAQVRACLAELRLLP